MKIPKCLIPFRIAIRSNDARSQNAALGSTYTLTPNLVNETRLGFSRLRLTLGMNEPLFDVNGVEEKLPQMNFGGSYPLFGGAGAFNTNNPGGGVALSRDTTYQVYDNVSWNHGRQALKFGAEVDQVNYNRYEAPAALGSFQFTGKFTGNTVADYLLGLRRPPPGRWVPIPSMRASTRIPSTRRTTSIFFRTWW